MSYCNLTPQQRQILLLALEGAPLQEVVDAGHAPGVVERTLLRAGLLEIVDGTYREVERSAALLAAVENMVRLRTLPPIRPRENCPLCGAKVSLRNRKWHGDALCQRLGPG
jgi:hypothetical protein